MTREEVFFSFVKHSDGCWNWLGSKYHNGYGCFWNGKKNDSAKIAVELADALIAELEKSGE